MIYKLEYNSREEGLEDIESKGIKYQAIVKLGSVELTEATYDTDYEIVEEATFSDTYLFDVMTKEIVHFDSEVFPENPKHKFA